MTIHINITSILYYFQINIFEMLINLFSLFNLIILMNFSHFLLKCRNIFKKMPQILFLVNLFIMCHDLTLENYVLLLLMMYFYTIMLNYQVLIIRILQLILISILNLF